MSTETETPPASEALAPIQTTGEGYKLFAPPQEIERRDGLIATAKAILIVSTLEQSKIAQDAMVSLAKFGREVEKSREAAKKPFLDGGKTVDDFAKTFRLEVDPEVKRLESIILTFNRAEEEKRRKAEAEALAIRQKAEREAQELERQRIAMEAEAERQKQAEAAKNFTGLDSMLGIAPQAIPEPSVAVPAGKSAAEVAAALRSAEEAAKAALEQAQADEFSALTAGPAVKGANKVISIEVDGDNGLALLYAKYPELVTLTLKLADTKERVKKFADAKGGDLPVIPGLVITYTDRLSKR